MPLRQTRPPKNRQRSFGKENSPRGKATLNTLGKAWLVDVYVLGKPASASSVASIKRSRRARCAILAT